VLDALAEHFPREADWTRPQGGLFIWARMPDYIDTTDLLARALQEQVAFVPGRAAYVDGRGGSAMRLNFSGIGEDGIREGIRRIGEVVREQVAMYSTLTGARPPLQETRGSEAPRGADADARTAAQAGRRAQPRPPDRHDAVVEEELAKVLRLPAKRTRAG
jgi:2-aminoadipate transaminase